MKVKDPKGREVLKATVPMNLIFREFYKVLGKRYRLSDKMIMRCKRFRVLYPDITKIDPNRSFDSYVATFEGGYIPINNLDLEILKDGYTIRWQKMAEWQRYTMVREGLLRLGSPRRVWEITEKDREYLKFKNRLRCLLSSKTVA